MPTPGLSIHLDLTALRPTPDRLLRLVGLFSGWGYAEVYLEWGDGFPWTVDERFRGEGAYSEELVVGLYREAANRRIALNAVFPSLSSLDFAARIPAYRHLFRWEPSGPILDIFSPAGRKFYGDLVEDFLGLVPEPGEVMLDCPGARSTPEELHLMTEPFRECSVSVALRCEDRRNVSGVRSEELSSLFDAFVLPVPGSSKTATIQPPIGSVIRGAKVFVKREQLSFGGRQERRPPSLQVSLQMPGGSGKDDVNSRTLLGSIETALLDVRAFARQASGGLHREAAAAEIGPRAGERAEFTAEAVDEAASTLALADELDKTLDSGWRYARKIREHLAEYSPRESCDSAFLHRMMKRLDRNRAKAQRLADALYERLCLKIDARALDRRLRAVVFPLFEEYHVLLPRIGHSPPRARRRPEEGRA